MARQQADREDLLLEAAALIDRAEVQIPDLQEPVVLGFRKNGASSFFFGQDPAIHFNQRLQLRRLYFEGQLLAADRGRLIVIDRTNEAGRLVLVHRPVAPAKEADMLASVRQRLEQLARGLAGEHRLLRFVSSAAGPRVQSGVQTDVQTVGHTSGQTAGHPAATPLPESLPLIERAVIERAVQYLQVLLEQPLVIAASPHVE